MNEKNGAVAAMLIGFGVCGAAYVGAPMLSPAEERAARLAAPDIERARRLLAEYRPDVDRAALLAADLEQDRISLVPEDIGEAVSRDSFREDYEAARDASLEAGGARPGGGIESQIREGMNVYRKVVGSNPALLKDALSAVDAALAVTVGEASMRNDPPANRLRGAILYQQGCATANAATLARGRIEPLLSDMTALARDARDVALQQNLVKDSGVDSKLAEIAAEISRHGESLARTTAELNALEQRIRESEAQLSEAGAEADAARLTFEELARKGQDFAHPDGFEQFSRAYHEQAKRYRQALRRAQIIEYGAYPAARIDDTGDYLAGRLLENGSDVGLTAQVGLDYLRSERERTAQVIKNIETTLAELAQVRTHLTQQKETWSADEAVARRRLAEARARAAELLEKIQQAEAEATRLEADAVTKFTQAAQSFKTALNGAEAALRDASEKSRRVSPSAQGFSGYTKQAALSVNVYHLATEQAEALAAAAWVLQQQQASRSGAAEVLTSAGEVLALPGEAAAALADAATNSTKEAITLVDQAVELLQRAHPQVGQRWTLTAEYAGVGYLYVLLGQPEVLAAVKQNYRAALDGRESEPMALPIKERLNYLETRSP